MTRTIKFRAWGGGEKKYFVYFDIYAERSGYFIDSFIQPDGSQRAIDYDDVVAIQQFTGLKDKNGKEIYEGDVVRGLVKFPQLLTGDNDENCNFKMVGVVFWDAAGFRLSCMKTQAMCDPERDGMVNYFDFHGPDGDDFCEMEVIGNIYEHPDLLQAKNK